MNTSIPRKLNWSCLVALTLLAPLGALAGPLQRQHVSAEPGWIVHVDVEKMKQSQVGQFLMAELDKPEAQDRFAAFQAVFNFDPRRNFKGLTLYGAGSAPQDAVMLVYGEFDADRLATLAKGAKEYQSSLHRQYVVHSWIDDKLHRHREGLSKRTFGAIHVSGTVIFGQKAERVTQALDVLDRLTPNLAATQNFTGWSPSAASAFVLAAARKPEVPDSAPNAAVFRQSKGISFVLGEADGQLVAEAVLEANSEEVARQISAILQGLLALASMQTERPEAVRFAQSISITQNGAQLQGTFKLPADEIIQALKNHSAKKDAR